MGFYFAWLIFYTAWLVIPAIFGVPLFIYQMYLIGMQVKDKEEINLDNPFNCLYCIILAIWSTVFIEMWKRRECEIAHMWNMTGYKGDDNEIADYRADYVIDPKAKLMQKKNLVDTYSRRLFGEIPVVVMAIAIIVGCFYGYYRFSRDNEG
jgi:branched-subunit amino acid permease